MIFGIGIDIVEVDRIDFFLETEDRMKKVFTEKEIEYIKYRKMSFETASGIWAAKEAFAKALGTGVVGFSLTDIEVIAEMDKRPIINLKDKAKHKAEEVGVSNIHLSISHEKKYAVANVVIEV